ncbi:MAG: Gfo/Idh/MocA family protein [Gaiellaceae bacterium]
MSSTRNESLRIGVVGGGMISQAMHLPHLNELGNRFVVAALAEPSTTVRDALCTRFGILGGFADWRSMLEDVPLDAVLVSSPAGTHVEIVLAALDAGLHVFCEKPLAITLADIDRIVERGHRAGRVVQVGYMKRHDPAFQRALAELPETAADIRYASIVVNDPEWVPYFLPGDIVRGADVPTDVVAAARTAESEQVEEAVGRGDPEACFAFSDGYLGSLVHHVNIVNGFLERMGEPLPARVVDAAWWNGGRSVAGYCELANGARWDSAWIQLLETREYRESITLYFDTSVRSLTFPSPWLKMSPTVYERQDGDEYANTVRRYRSFEEAFRRELVHFHDCCVDGAACLTPPEQARVDTDVLTRMFLAAGRTGD